MVRYISRKETMNKTKLKKTKPFISIYLTNLMAILLLSILASLTSCSYDGDNKYIINTTEPPPSYLFAIYADGQGENEEEVYSKLLDTNRALSFMQELNGKEKQGYGKIKSIALFGGLGEKGKYDTKLMELIGGEYTDLTSKTSWVNNTVDMQEGATLQNFLSYIADNYFSDKVVLLLLGKGAGPANETSYIPPETKGRTLCFGTHEGEGNKGLSAIDIKSALEKAALTPSLLWQIANYQDSIEIAYDLRGTASLLLTTPTNQKDFLFLALQEFTSYATTEQACVKIISKYYLSSNTLPFSLLQLKDAKKLESVKTAINDLSLAIISDKEEKEAIKTTLLDTTNATLSYYAVLHDIGELTNKLQGFLPLKDALKLVEESVKKIVLYNRSNLYDKTTNLGINIVTSYIAPDKEEDAERAYLLNKDYQYYSEFGRENAWSKVLTSLVASNPD